MVGIYKFTNKIDGKSYIGQSRNIQKRYNAHKTKYYENKNTFEDTYFHRMLRYYGFDNFDFSVLEECDVSELNEKEKFYIEQYKSLYPGGYNKTKGGDSPSLIGFDSYDQVLKIKELLAENKLSNIEIGDMFGVSDQTICDINSGRTWFDNDINYPIRDGAKRRMQFTKRSYCQLCGKEIERNAKLCIDCSKVQRRKHVNGSSVEVPSKDELVNLLANNSFEHVARMYKISSSSVRRWCDRYGIPRHSSFYRNINTPV